MTKEKGFLPVGQIKLGMHVLRADGTYGVVTGWKVVPGTQVMYNLEVAQDHTFTVGTGQWVVHNCGLDAREQHVLDNFDSLVPNHGGEGGNILYEDKVPSFNGSKPDFVTPNAIVEVSGEGHGGSIPQKLLSGGRGQTQLANYARGAGPSQSVYLLYEGDVSKFPDQLVNFLNKWNINVIPFSRP